jgi:MFS family permease
MEALIIARAVAGMGGGGVMTVSSIAISDLVPFAAYIRE